MKHCASKFSPQTSIWLLGLAALCHSSCNNPLGELDRTDDSFCNAKEVNCSDLQDQDNPNDERKPIQNDPSAETAEDGSSEPNPYSWSFVNQANYDFAHQYVSVSGGQATLKQVNQSHDSSEDFNLGSHHGTVFTDGRLSLGSANGCDGSTVNCSELSAESTPQWDHLQAYWTFNNSWADAKGANDGMGSNGAAFSTDVKIGSHSSVFDGVDDKMANSSFAWAAGQEVTVMFWNLVTTADMRNGSAFSVGDNTNERFQCHAPWGDGNIYWDYGNIGGTGRLFTDYTPFLDKWTHVTLVSKGDGGSFRAIYLDGREMTSANSSEGPSVALSGVTIGGAYPSTVPYMHKGNIDDFAIWNKVLTEDEIRAIFNRQAADYAGSYTSEVVDLGTSGPWNTFGWTTPLPFGKELPGNSGNESVADYPELSNSQGTLGDSDLNDDLSAIWHLNETAYADVANEVLDSSAQGHHGRAKNGASGSKEGRMRGAGVFDGSDDYVLTTHRFSNAADFSISLWAKNAGQTSLAGSTLRPLIVAHGTGSSFGSANPAIGLSAMRAGSASPGDIQVQVGNSVIDVPVEFDDGRWHLVTVVRSGANFTFFYDGNERATGSVGSINIVADTVIGAAHLNDSAGARYFHGMIDEVAIWQRALDPAEVLELYRRGANDIKFQIRSCDDAACDGEAWIGPDGMATSYFSELLNCSSIDNATGECSGATGLTAPGLQLADFVTSPNNNRYFQYRVLLESDDIGEACSGPSPCMPGLSGVEIGPAGRYFGGIPTISNKESVSFGSALSFSENKTGGCTVTYHLSPDGTNFLYWNGSSWATASGVGQSNDAATVSAHIDKFTGTKLYWQAFLASDTYESCQLQGLNVSYEP